jgi:hypothetical protein
MFYIGITSGNRVQKKPGFSMVEIPGGKEYSVKIFI